jgi:CheY-like chemotaxis protein
MQRVLVIDDQSHVRAAVGMALRAKGFDVVTAENGFAALRALRAAPFDLAIVDIFMPEMDGVKLIKTFRERNPKFPLIAVSGVQLSGTGRTALDLFHLAPELAGVVCLQKPFGSAELLQAIAKAMAAAGVESPLAAPADASVVP